MTVLINVFIFGKFSLLHDNHLYMHASTNLSVYYTVFLE